MASNTGQLQITGGGLQGFDGGEPISLPADAGSVDNFGVSDVSGGVPRIGTGGVHYSNSWNGDGIRSGTHMLANYRFINSSIEPSSHTYFRQSLPDSIYEQIQQANSHRADDRQSLSGVYELALDSSSCLRLSFAGLSGSEHNQDVFMDSTLLNRREVNDSRRNTNAYVDNRGSLANITWRRRFVEPGKTLSAYLGFSNDYERVYGYLFAENNFYLSDSSLSFRDSTDLRKDNKGSTRNLEVSSVYSTLMFSKFIELVTGYSLAFTHIESRRNSFGRGDGKYDTYIDSLSSKYDFDIVTQRVHLNTQIKKKSWLYTFGTDISYANCFRQDIMVDTTTHYHFLSFFPSLHVRWNISPIRAFNFHYSGSATPPSISQIQPIKSNSDPLNLIIGNAGLQPSYLHSFRLGWNDHKPLMGRYFYFDLVYGFTVHAFSSRNIVDSLGRTLTQTVNVNGNKNAVISFLSAWRLRPLNIDLGVRGNLIYTRSVNFVNGQLNRSDNYTPWVGVNIGQNVPDKFNFSLNFNYNYAWSRNSVNQRATTQYWTGQWIGQFGVNLPWQMEINSNATYSWRQKIGPMDANSAFTLWNADLDKRFLRNALTVRIGVNDILNQNTGINRAVTANQYTETSFTAIHRYWLLSLIWNFRTRDKSDK
ncbi:outer membrane beta-barrel protein [Puia sp. P3]|uniref:outer membrane beta-barrel protein n=1 Tax=Puia sp. P3 TaxID=3423952 RepID=UPI003D670C5C